MKLIYVLGARPNFVKMAPVISRLSERLPDAEHVIVHTGQHYDREMSQVFFDELEVPEPQHLLAVGSGSHAAQTARVMERLEPVLESLEPDLVLVPGDVNSTLGAALVAAKLQVPLAHIESGLRSFDRSMPEEINRLVTDTLSQHLFTHSDDAVGNLQAEGIPADRIHLVGNTMIDSLVALESRFRSAGQPERLGLVHGDYLLVTLHRPALVEGPLLFGVMERLRVIARTLPVIFPVHPRTRKVLAHFEPGPGLMLADPLGYLDFLSLEAHATAVLTDSGGVQEETTYLGVPCFTLRDSTERPVTLHIGTNHLLGLNPARIDDVLPILEAGVRPAGIPPYWDGAAAERIATILSAALSRT